MPTVLGATKEQCIVNCESTSYPMVQKPAGLLAVAKRVVLWDITGSKQKNGNAKTPPSKKKFIIKIG